MRNLKILQKTEKKKKRIGKRSLCAFFFSWFGCFNDDFAFSSTFRNDAQLCCRHVSSTCEGVVAFAALPDANAFAFHFDEAALWAFVGNFESSGDLPCIVCGLWHRIVFLSLELDQLSLFLATIFTT